MLSKHGWGGRSPAIRDFQLGLNANHQLPALVVAIPLASWYRPQAAEQQHGLNFVRTCR